eukprot:gene5693-8893_t
MINTKLFVAIALAVALLAPFARADEPCCVGACTVAGEAKYYSVDTMHDMCGECCMNPKNAVRTAPCHSMGVSNTPFVFLLVPGWPLVTNFTISLNLDSALQMESPHAGELNYTLYDSTVTHGAGPIKMTLDLYKPCPDTKRCPPPPIK